MSGVSIQVGGSYKQVADLTPPGTIVAYGGNPPGAGTVGPDGWFLCDGSAVSRTTYANLFAAIGTAYGSSDSFTFNLPDLRGVFLRGVDFSAGKDPDKAGRGILKAGGNSGNNVGSLQSCATKVPTNPFVSATESAAHTHNFTLGNNNSPSSIAHADSGAFSAGATGAENQNHTHSIGVGAGTGGDNETRPVNVYVNYIIKI